MKKFVIISVVLVLVAVSVFGIALVRYIKVNSASEQKDAEAVESVEETKAAAEKSTEASNEKRADSAVNAADIFDSGREQAESYVASMTTEEMVGQLILGICPDPSTAAAEVKQYSLAGMLFTNENFQGMTKEQIPETLTAASNDLKTKPILAAQEEGGTITTLSDLPGYEEYDFNAPRTEFDNGGLQGVEKIEEDKTAILKEAGFNMNLTPVIDLATSSDQIMYTRSISGDAETVSSYAEYAAKFDQPRGISVVLSHFPGYGTIPDSADNGVEAVVDDREADTIRSTDYTPFKQGAAAGAHCVMMSNVVVRKIDADHTAALSTTLHSELRDTVGFSGIIMTDVLDDKDYSAYSDGKKPAVQAVLAGNDLILVRDYATAYNDILSAVKDGTVSEAQLKEACTRVIAYKYTAKIMK